MAGSTASGAGSCERLERHMATLRWGAGGCLSTTCCDFWAVCLSMCSEGGRRVGVRQPGMDGERVCLLLAWPGQLRKDVLPSVGSWSWAFGD